MQSNRRSLLKGLAAAGMAVTGLGWAHAAVAPAGAAAAPTAGGVLTVTSATTALEQAFIAGVQNAGQATHTGLMGLDSAAFTQLGDLLADGQDTVLVGLLDDASATLVLDLVRSAGGRVMDVQHHRVPAAAAPWAHKLGQTLAAGEVAPTVVHVAGTEPRVSFRCVI